MLVLQNIISGNFITPIPVAFFMRISKIGRSYKLFLLILVMVSVIAVIINPSYAQTGQTADNPFVVVFSLGGVDNSTGIIANWVTSHNITNAAYYNASQVDLQDARPNDGFVESSVVLPNGTLQVGDEYTACTIILKDAYLTCDKGFNAPTNRAEFDSVLIP
jgi:hypothetical protein